MFIDDLNYYNKIIMWGAGNDFLQGYHRDFHVDFLIDSDPGKVGTVIGNMTVHPVTMLSSLGKERLLIVISSEKYYEEISEQAAEMTKALIADTVTLNEMEYIYGTKNNSFCLFGIDALVSDIMERSGFKYPDISYVEIGANHPYFGSATAMMYMRGSSGILIEPNPDLKNTLKRLRPRDKVLTMGIGDKNGEMLFYKMDNSYRNSFDYVQVEKNINRGYKLLDQIPIEVRPLNEVIEENNIDVSKTYLSLQVMGSEKQVLECFDHKKYKFPVISVAYYSDDVLDMNIFQDYKTIASVPRHVILATNEVYERIYK